MENFEEIIGRNTLIREKVLRNMLYGENRRAHFGRWREKLPRYGVHIAGPAECLYSQRKQAFLAIFCACPLRNLFLYDEGHDRGLVLQLQDGTDEFPGDVVR